MAKDIFRKWLLCLFLSFILFIIVWFSEIFHNIVLAVSSGWSSGIFVLMLFSVAVFFLFVFGIVPLCLLSLLLIYPKLMKKFFAAFGVTEELLEKKKKNEDKNGDA